MTLNTALTATRTLTQDELDALLVERFGPDPRWWTFGCPRCGELADAGDFLLAGVDANANIGQRCIGRALGALKPGSSSTDSGRSSATRGCDWTANGLFKGPWMVTVPRRDPITRALVDAEDTKTIGAFAAAPVSRDSQRTEAERAAVREAWAQRRPLVDGDTQGPAPVTDGPTGTAAQ
jgi:hypothetical protein